MADPQRAARVAGSERYIASTTLPVAVPSARAGVEARIGAPHRS